MGKPEVERIPGKFMGWQKLHLLCKCWQGYAIHSLRVPAPSSGKIETLPLL
jgi:hypothetical protein